MTTSPPNGLRGAQTPRLASYPAYESSAGQEAVDLARAAGLTLDPWQQLVLRHALGERGDGRWTSFEVGLVVSRQNGKGSILEARELAGLFLFNEPLIIHSAHLFDTSLEHFLRVLSLIEGTPDLDSRVKRVSRSHGEEGIELKHGPRLRFKTRTKGGGRGFSGTTVILDEAYDLPETAISALMPTMSAQPNPQLWYTSSAVDQAEHDNGIVLARVRQRGLDGGDPSLCYLEWSAAEDSDPKDPQAQAQANPGAAIRISFEHIAREQRSMGAKAFGVERLGIGDWPAEGVIVSMIDAAAWGALADARSTPLDPVAVGVEATPDRRYAAIASAGARADGLLHGELVDLRPGMGWVLDRIVALRQRWGPCAIVLRPDSAAGAFIPGLLERGIEPYSVAGREYGQACGAFHDACTGGTLRHVGQAELTAALLGARARKAGDAWAWDWRGASVNIAPLVAVTLALHGFAVHGRDAGRVLEGALMA